MPQYAPALLADAVPDAREVHELVSVRVEDVYAARARPEYHRVAIADRAGVVGPAARGGDWWFESPTLHLNDVRGIPRTLWGVAGYMTVRLRSRFPSPADLLRGG